MARHTENDESYQEKVNRLEATVTSLKERIDDLSDLVFSLLDARNPVHNVPSSGLSAPVTPIYTIAPPTMQVAPTFECNEESNGEGIPSAKENNGITTNGNGLSSQAGSGEAENENVNILDQADPPVYNGIGNPHDHLKAFLEWVAKFGQSNGIKLRLFVKTLAGPALTWFATQDMGKRFAWDDLARNFVKQFELPNRICDRGSPLKRKSVEIQEEPVAITLGPDKRKCKLVEAQSKDKGKAVMLDPLPVITREPNAIKQVAVDTSSQSSRAKRPALAFTQLPESYASLFERLKRVNLVHPIEPKPCWSLKPENFGKFCIYHSGMHGHYIGECVAFKKKIEDLINSGQVKVLPSKGHGQSFVTTFPYAKGGCSKKGI